MLLQQMCASSQKKMEFSLKSISIKYAINITNVINSFLSLMITEAKGLFHHSDYCLLGRLQNCRP